MSGEMEIEINLDPKMIEDILKRQWIKCSETMPLKYQDVLIKTKSDFPMVAFHGSKVEWTVKPVADVKCDAEWWMPIPSTK